MNDLTPEERAVHELFRELRERHVEVSDRFLRRLHRRLELTRRLRGGAPQPEQIAGDLAIESLSLASDLLGGALSQGTDSTEESD